MRSRMRSPLRAEAARRGRRRSLSAGRNPTGRSRSAGAVRRRRRKSTRKERSLSPVHCPKSFDSEECSGGTENCECGNIIVHNREDRDATFQRHINEAEYYVEGLANDKGQRSGTVFDRLYQSRVTKEMNKRELVLKLVEEEARDCTYVPLTNGIRRQLGNTPIKSRGRERRVETARREFREGRICMECLRDVENHNSLSQAELRQLLRGEGQPRQRQFLKADESKKSPLLKKNGRRSLAGFSPRSPRSPSYGFHSNDRATFHIDQPSAYNGSEEPTYNGSKEPSEPSEEEPGSFSDEFPSERTEYYEYEEKNNQTLPAYIDEGEAPGYIDEGEASDYIDGGASSTEERDEPPSSSEGNDFATEENERDPWFDPPMPYYKLDGESDETACQSDTEEEIVVNPPQLFERKNGDVNPHALKEIDSNDATNIDESIESEGHKRAIRNLNELFDHPNYPAQPLVHDGPVRELVTRTIDTSLKLYLAGETSEHVEEVKKLLSPSSGSDYGIEKTVTFSDTVDAREICPDSFTLRSETYTTDGSSNFSSPVSSPRGGESITSYASGSNNSSSSTKRNPWYLLGWLEKVEDWLQCVRQSRFFCN